MLLLWHHEAVLKHCGAAGIAKYVILIEYFHIMMSSTMAPKKVIHNAQQHSLLCVYLIPLHVSGYVRKHISTAAWPHMQHTCSERWELQPVAHLCSALTTQTASRCLLGIIIQQPEGEKMLPGVNILTPLHTQSQVIVLFLLCQDIGEQSVKLTTLNSQLSEKTPPTHTLLEPGS